MGSPAQAAGAASAKQPPSPYTENNSSRCVEISSLVSCVVSYMVSCLPFADTQGNGLTALQKSLLWWMVFFFNFEAMVGQGKLSLSFTQAQKHSLHPPKSFLPPGDCSSAGRTTDTFSHWNSVLGAAGSGGGCGGVTAAPSCLAL